MLTLFRCAKDSWRKLIEDVHKTGEWEGLFGREYARNCIYSTAKTRAVAGDLFGFAEDIAICGWSIFHRDLLTRPCV